MVWSMMQRVILEVEGRLTWVLTAESVYHDTARTRQPLLNVVGAVTDQMEVAENLYRVRRFSSTSLPLSDAVLSRRAFRSGSFDSSAQKRAARSSPGSMRRILLPSVLWLSVSLTPRQSLFTP